MTKQQVVIPAPELRGGALALMRTRDLEVALDGPAGTGKTYAALLKIHLILLTYPGAKVLVARKSNTALAGSAMATFREMLDPRENVHYFGGNKVKPAAFEYGNGSLMIMNGLDKPEKVKSWEFDMAYINEATECTLEDIEFVRSRLRRGKTPYRQLIMDCNPGPPTHWLNARMNDGITTRLLSRHQDNPRFYDTKTGTWTEEGAAYIQVVLAGLTGVRKKRLLDGIWASAEGMVYDEWDPALHKTSKARLIEWGILTADEKPDRKTAVKKVVAGVDWGYTNPGVIQVWAIDGDGRLYLVHEVYQTGKDIDWWLEKAKRLKQEFGIEQFICDPAEPSFIEQFNKHRLNAVAAINDIAPGISAVQARLKIAGDGRPRLYLYEYALKERDEKRVEAHQPFCLEGEMTEYVWPKSKDGQPVKEVPVKVNDHAVDGMRYVCMYLSDPTPTAQDHLDALKRRLEKAREGKQG